MGSTLTSPTLQLRGAARSSSYSRPPVHYSGRAQLLLAPPLAAPGARRAAPPRRNASQAVLPGTSRLLGRRGFSCRALLAPTADPCGRYSRMSLDEGPQLLPAGPDSNTCARRLLVAAMRGDSALLAAMLDAGANVNQPVTTWRQTLLHFGARGSLVKLGRAANLVRFLLAEGADVHAADLRGNRPLHAAAGSCGVWCVSHADAVEALLHAGADVRAVNHAGKTALHLAAEQGRTEVVRLLMEAGAPLGARCRRGETAEEAARRSGQLHVAQLLAQELVMA